jgi:hypothetical protein
MALPSRRSRWHAYSSDASRRRWWDIEENAMSQVPVHQPGRTVARHGGPGRVLLMLSVACGCVLPNALARSISILSGTYGPECGAPDGNATRELAGICNGRESCDYVVDSQRVNQTADDCPKSLIVQWQCDSSEDHLAMLSRNARSGDTLSLSCAVSSGAGK